MNPLVQTYDPQKVIITFGGVPLSGYADGTFVKVTPAADTFTKKVGADGEVARVRSADNTSEVEITLMETSLSNAILNGFAIADRAGGTAILPLSITDLSMGDVQVWPQAWIKKRPEVTKGKELADRSWVFETGQPLAEVLTGDVLPG